MQSERPSRSKAIPPPSGRDYQFYDVLKTNSCFESLRKTTRSLTPLQRICSRASCVDVHVHTPNLWWILLSLSRGMSVLIMPHLASAKLHTVLNDTTCWSEENIHSSEETVGKNLSRQYDCKIAKKPQKQFRVKTIPSLAAVHWPAVALASRTEMIGPTYTLRASSMLAKFVQECFLRPNSEKLT